MKKRFFTILLSILVVCLTLVGCGSNPDDTKVNSEYVGEWKANQISSVMDGETTYKTVSILLNADGTGSYKDKQGTWEHKDDAIVLTLTNENIGMVLEIKEEDGKTVLKYYQDVFYKASEFVEK